MIEYKNFKYKGSKIMQEFKTIEIKRSVFEDNDKEANKVRDELKENKTFY